MMVKRLQNQIIWLKSSSYQAVRLVVMSLARKDSKKNKRPGRHGHFLDCSVVFSTIVHSARQRLSITSPYFVPDDIMVRALQNTSIGGLDVRILILSSALLHRHSLWPSAKNPF